MKNFIPKFILSFCVLFLSSSLIAQKFFPSVDSYIDEAAPTTVQNTSSSHKLVVRNFAENNRISFMEFNIGDFDKQVGKAELCLYLFNIPTGLNMTETVEIYEVTTGDINNNITWNNFNGAYTLNDTPLTSLDVTTGASLLDDAYGWYKFDMTDLFNQIAKKSGADKKLKLALKAKTNKLLLNFASSESTQSFYRPVLVITPEKMSNIVLQTEFDYPVNSDNYISSQNADSNVDNQSLFVGFNNSNGAMDHINFRFRVPPTSAVVFDKDHYLTVRTKIRTNAANTPFLVDLYGLPDQTEIAGLTWSSMPAASSMVYLGSHLFNKEEIDNEAEFEWDVTDYMKARQLEGKDYTVLSLQVQNIGSPAGQLWFYPRNNFLNTDPEKVPRFLIYKDDGTVGGLSPNSYSNRNIIIEYGQLSVKGLDIIDGKIFNLQGALKMAVNKAPYIDISTLSQGVYILRLSDNSTFKFIKN